MVESAGTKILQQALVTGIPASLHARGDLPLAGATQASLTGSVRPAPHHTARRRRTLTTLGVAAFNRLPLTSKTIGAKTTFSTNLKTYLKNCRTMYLHSYETTILSQHPEHAARRDDITYYIDENGKLIRNLITLKQYTGKL